MTTYPLSEPATVFVVEDPDTVASKTVGHGTLEDCADIVAGLPTEQQRTAVIKMDDLDLGFQPDEIAELLQFLKEESAGLSNNDITEIKTANS